MLRYLYGGWIPGAPRRDLGAGADVNPSTQKRTGRQDHGVSGEAAAVRSFHALHLILLEEEPGDHPLRELQERDRLEQLPHRAPIQGAIALRARGPHSGPLGAVQHAELNGGAIGGAPHDAAQGVDFAHDGALGNPADGRVAAHLSDGIERGGEQEGASAEPGGHGGGFGSGVAATDDNDIIVNGHDAKDKRRGAETASGCRGARK